MGDWELHYLNTDRVAWNSLDVHMQRTGIHALISVLFNKIKLDFCIYEIYEWPSRQKKKKHISWSSWALTMQACILCLSSVGCGWLTLEAGKREVHRSWNLVSTWGATIWLILNLKFLDRTCNVLSVHIVTWSCFNLGPVHVHKKKDTGMHSILRS